MPDNEIYINIGFPIEWYFDDDNDFEERLENLAPRNHSGSGAGFGQRDVGFYFKTRKGADNFKSRVDKLVKTLSKRDQKQVEISDD